ncbi:MAG: TIGR01459 family HAD-type hydrolase [Rhodospirillaceae bacterium]|nr:MAG: TIGR01459 family HAD-type hydrolase [Rhodospirillaceae bacterium]
MSLQPIPGLAAIADRFDGFILDLWGVVHDGVSPYPPVISTLQSLYAAGKKTLLLSNAPRRAFALVDAMSAMGIDRALYGEVLSSGEVTRDALIARDDPFFARLGTVAYHLGPERDRNVFADTGVTIVDDLDAATFIVNTGPIDFTDTVDTYLHVLTVARARNLPMVCANPDIVVIREGHPVVCAGAIAVRYEAMGGSVAYRGKPDRAVYDAALVKLGAGNLQRIAVVGDALETDIKGAAAAGLRSIWCTGGIHAAALGVSYGNPADPEKAAALAAAHGYAPDFIIPGFIW